MWYVYILQSEKNGSYYKGHTSDLVRRIEEHNSGKEPYSRKFMPWRLFWSCVKASKTEAILLEKKLKNITGCKRIEAFIKKYS